MPGSPSTHKSTPKKKSTLKMPGGYLPRDEGLASMSPKLQIKHTDSKKLALQSPEHSLIEELLLYQEDYMDDEFFLQEADPVDGEGSLQEEDLLNQDLHNMAQDLPRRRTLTMRPPAQSQEGLLNEEGPTNEEYLLDEEDLFDEEDLANEHLEHKAYPSDMAPEPAAGQKDTDEDYTTAEPFRFLECDPKIRQNILDFVLVKRVGGEEKTVTPYYNQYSVERTYDDEGLDLDNNRDNIDISLLLALAGNQEAYEEALNALYGGNTFYLVDPRCSIWWLERIGERNIARLRHLELSLTQGPGAWRVREERVWWRLLLRLKPHQQLKTMSVSFENWNNDYIIEESLEEASAGYPPVDEPRRGVFLTMLSFRGLKSALVCEGTEVSERKTAALEQVMGLPDGEFESKVKELWKSWAPTPGTIDLSA